MEIMTAAKNFYLARIQNYNNPENYYMVLNESCYTSIGRQCKTNKRNYLIFQLFFFLCIKKLAEKWHSVVDLLASQGRTQGVGRRSFLLRISQKVYIFFQSPPSLLSFSVRPCCKPSPWKINNNKFCPVERGLLRGNWHVREKVCHMQDVASLGQSSVIDNSEQYRFRESNHVLENAASINLTSRLALFTE